MRSLRIHDHDPLHQIPQLAHIARPGVFFERAERLRGQFFRLAAIGGRELAQEMIGQQAHVFDPLPQRRHMKRDHIQAVEQIFAEIAALDFLFQILVGGGDHAHVHLNGFRGAHRLKALLFERPQNLGLRLERHVADFIQEQRSAVGLLQLADFVVARAGEAALAMPEQLALDQLFGNRGAVHFDEGFARARGLAA